MRAQQPLDLAPKGRISLTGSIEHDAAVRPSDAYHGVKGSVKFSGINHRGRARQLTGGEYTTGGFTQDPREIA